MNCSWSNDVAAASAATDRADEDWDETDDDNDNDDFDGTATGEKAVTVETAVAAKARNAIFMVVKFLDLVVSTVLRECVRLLLSTNYDGVKKNKIFGSVWIRKRRGGVVWAWVCDRPVTTEQNKQTTSFALLLVLDFSSRRTNRRKYDEVEKTR